MGWMGRLHEIRFIVVFLIAVPLEAVTVNPSLCPTNKIAPHKRIANWEYGTGRTFGAFYDLLAPGNPQYDAPNAQNDLQEQPQEDDPSDCGEIDDYDENDLSSITQQGTRRQDRRDSRGFFIGSLFGPSHNKPQRPPPNYPQRPPNYPQRPPDYPQRPPDYPQRPPDYPQRPPNYPPPPNYPQRPPAYPQRPPRPGTDRPQGPPYPSVRPPYWSGGFFGSNDYRPPTQENPSDNIKPINEYSEDSQMTYRPNVVGGSLGHVVGVSPIIPTSQQEEETTPRTFFNLLRASTPSPNTEYPTRRPRPRNINNNGIFGSFVDLLFK